MDKIKRLEVYIQQINFSISNCADVHKRAFFERELRKTKAKITELQNER